jgi:hypothetical protein
MRNLILNFIFDTIKNSPNKNYDFPNHKNFINIYYKSDDYYINLTDNNNKFNTLRLFTAENNLLIDIYNNIIINNFKQSLFKDYSDDISY